MVTDQTEYIPITTEEAVEAVLRGAWIYHAEIPDFRALIEGVQKEAEEREFDLGNFELRCVSARIVGAKCQNLRIGMETSFRSSESSNAARAESGEVATPTVFACEAVFEDAIFAEAIDFRGVIFGHEANFRGSSFQADCDFSFAKFSGNAEFRSATFNKRTAFSSVTFERKAAFMFAEVNGNITFHDARFSGDVVFSAATLAQNAHFDLAEFGDTGRFVNATLGARLTFNLSRFGASGRLNFDMLDLRPGARIRLSLEQLRRSPLIEGEDSREKRALASAAVQYTMLRDNFRALPTRTDDEEDLCHYKAMDLRRRASEWFWLWRFLDWFFFKCCWGYGVYPLRIVATVMAVIFGFGAVYYLGAGPETIKHYYVIAPGAASDLGGTRAPEVGGGSIRLAERPANTDMPPERKAVDSIHDPPYPAGQVSRAFDPNHGPASRDRATHQSPHTEFNPWYFSIITFTTIGYGDYAPRGWIRWVAGLEGFLGLFLMAVFTVSFARKFIR